MEAIWEIVENLPFIIELYRTTTISKDYTGDSVANSVIDILACVLGYWIAYRLRVGQSVMLFLVTEFVLMLTIRDSLILNVLMLIWPIELIEQWQLESNHTQLAIPPQAHVAFFVLLLVLTEN